MIPHGVEVFVGLDPIDLRWGYHRLTGLVAERMGRDARSGALFVFFGKRRSRVTLCIPPLETWQAKSSGVFKIRGLARPTVDDSLYAYLDLLG